MDRETQALLRGFLEACISQYATPVNPNKPTPLEKWAKAVKESRDWMAYVPIDEVNPEFL